MYARRILTNGGRPHRSQLAFSRLTLQSGAVLIGVKNAHKYGHINYLSDYLNEFWSQYFSARLLKAAVVAVGLVRAHGSGAHANLAFCVMPAIYV